MDPGPGIKPVSPAVAGGFFTSEPPEKSLRLMINSICSPSPPRKMAGAESSKLLVKFDLSGDQPSMSLARLASCFYHLGTSKGFRNSVSGTKSRDQIYISDYITVTNKRIKIECIYSKLVNEKQGNKENSIWKGRQEGKKKQRQRDKAQKMKITK